MIRQVLIGLIIITPFLYYIHAQNQDSNKDIETQFKFRTYHLVTINQLVHRTVRDTHIKVRGFVTYINPKEKDGDTHIRVCSVITQLQEQNMDKKSCIVVECIPELKCIVPVVGSQIEVKGIRRFDDEHDWMEIHPVEALTIIK